MHSFLIAGSVDEYGMSVVCISAETGAVLYAGRGELIGYMEYNGMFGIIRPFCRNSGKQVHFAVCGKTGHTVCFDSAFEMNAGSGSGCVIICA